MITRIKLTLTGTHSLILHNVQLADPFCEYTKAIKKITDKKKDMTEEDLKEKLRLEFLGSLYYDKSVGVYIPGENIGACLVTAAKATRLGTAMKQALFIDSDVNPLQYEGPRKPSELWEDENFRHKSMVRVTSNRVLRSRPQFRQWAVSATGVLDETIISMDRFEDIVRTAGKRTGLGDYRPRFGRFNGKVEVGA